MTAGGWGGREPGGCDLHAHTSASDGRLPPAELIGLAHSVGLEAVAVTDHDTLAGLAEARAAAARLGVRVVPGVEINARRDGRAVHVLGYFCRGGDEMQAFFEERRSARAQRMERMVARLRAAGVDVRLDHVVAAAGGAVLGRPHLAHALVEGGHAADVSDAFRRYLVPGAPGFASLSLPDPTEAADRIRADGGVPVLAHPGLVRDDRIVLSLLPHMSGIEAHHSDHGPDAAARYAAMAATAGLVATGGSDFHGNGHHGDLGQVRLPLSVVTAIEDLAGS